MTISRVRPLVSTNWLVERLSALKSSSQLRILDTSYNADPSFDSYSESYKPKHIPGSVYFDIHHCVKSTPEIPRNLPDLTCFTNYLQDLGISSDTHVVAYDRVDNKAACRTRWTLKLHGHEQVSVLDGGLGKWIADGHPTTSEEPHYERGDFQPQMNVSLLRTFEAVLKNTRSEKETILDCRMESDFVGSDEAGGHIPNSKNLPYHWLFNEDGTFRSEEELRRLFEDAEVDLSKPLVATCQLGMTACGLSLAAEMISKKTVPVYYGSWREWSQRATEELKVKGYD